VSLETGAVVGARYEIQALAGSGGMGCVYRALDRVSGRLVAVKILARGGAHQARFRREAEVLSKLAHSHVAAYLGHGDGSDGGPSYLVMEWVEGTSLRERLLTGPLAPNECVALGLGVAEALASAHAQGVVHRDVKPENLLLPEGDVARVKVLDFGVALAPSARERMTRTGTPLGTIGYMAPEQVRGELDVDARADVFALGAVLFECLTGQAPFHADHALSVLANIVLEDAPRVRVLSPAVPRELDELVHAMLSKERAGRPRDGAQVAERLRGLGQGLPPPSAGPSVRPSALTRDERLFACALVGDARDLEAGRTLLVEELEQERHEREGIVRDYAGRFETLGARSFVALFAGRGEPRGIAERAARAALALGAAGPELGLALVSTRASEHEPVPVARAVDGAAELLGARAGTGVALDAGIAALLSARFVVHELPSGAMLSGEQRDTSVTRPVLGKPTPCVGRQRELETLRATWEECRSEPVARAVLVTGPAGIGKSRILSELAPDFVGAEVWRGRGDAMRAGTPFALLASALGTAFGLSHASLEDNRAALAHAIEQRVPADERARITAFVAELAGLPFADELSRELRAARQDPILMGDQIRRAFEDLVAHVAARRALVLVLDDLAWGDAPSAKLVDAALRRAADLPFLVVGAGRAELHDALPELWVERDVQEVRVAPLSWKAANDLVERVLGDADSALVERAAGNPLYLEELMRARADGRSAAPGSVLAMIQARLDALDAEGRRVLRAASVFGLGFWQGAVEALVPDLDGARVATWLSALVERELLLRSPESRFDAEPELSFASELVRDAAHAALTDDDRRLGHRLAAAWLEAHGERDARLLAEHLEQGELPASAIPWWLRAVSGALEANAFADALAFVARAKAAGATGRELGALRVAEAEALRWTGELARALSASTEGLALLQAGTPRWCHGIADRALLLQRLGRSELLPELARSLLGRSVRDAPSDALAFALVRTALFCLLAGHEPLAHELADTAAHVERSGAELEPATRGQAAVFRALTALYRGDLSSYLREELEARRAFEDAGDVRRALNESGSIGFAQLELGSWTDAERTLEEALERAEAMGLEHVRAASWHNLGLVYARLGRFEAAREVEQRALDVFRAQSDRRLEGAALTYLAEIALLGGDAAEAERLAREALALVSQVAPPIEPLARGILGAARLALGDAAEALEHATAAVRRADAGGVEAGESLSRGVYAESLAALGRADDAAVARADAKARLEARASRIEDPVLRRRFLENVPENALIMAFEHAATDDA